MTDALHGWPVAIAEMPCCCCAAVAGCCRDGKPSNAVVLGEVVMFHIADSVAGRSPTGKLVVDPTKLQPVCRLGGVTYGRVTELYNIPRPDKSGAYPAAAAKR
jgi:flavin reductase (DIM6/NTAB) family NADH-FMN oxidoreductase RutF